MLFMSAKCFRLSDRELFTGDVVRKASSLAADLEHKTSLRPILPYHRRMAKRLERNIVDYTKEGFIKDRGLWWGRRRYVPILCDFKVAILRCVRGWTFEDLCPTCHPRTLSFLGEQTRIIGWNLRQSPVSFRNLSRYCEFGAILIMMLRVTALCRT